MTKEELLKMELHEVRSISSEEFRETSVRRVVRGWVYSTAVWDFGGENIQSISMCFVPE